MIAIFKREVKNYLKRPLFWIGIVLVIYGVFNTTSPYLTTHYLAPGEKIVNDYPDTIHLAEVYEDIFLPVQENTGNYGMKR